MWPQSVPVTNITLIWYYWMFILAVGLPFALQGLTTLFIHKACKWVTADCGTRLQLSLMTLQSISRHSSPLMQTLPQHNQCNSYCYQCAGLLQPRAGETTSNIFSFIHTPPSRLRQPLQWEGGLTAGANIPPRGAGHDIFNKKKRRTLFVPKKITRYI